MSIVAAIFICTALIIWAIQRSTATQLMTPEQRAEQAEKEARARPLMIALMVGLVVSTLLILFLVPILFDTTTSP